MKKLKKITLEGFDRLSTSESSQLFGGVGEPITPITPSVPTPAPPNINNIITNAPNPSVSIGQGGTATGSYTYGNVKGTVDVNLPSGKVIGGSVTYTNGNFAVTVSVGSNGVPNGGSISWNF
jgi:hypothetical protein